MVENDGKISGMDKLHSTLAMRKLWNGRRPSLKQWDIIVRVAERKY